MALQTKLIDSEVFFIGYKVVTQEIRSLGLKHNKNILTFPVDKWIYLPEDMIEASSKDFGGIWAARTLGNAKKLKEYMLKKYSTKTRIFIAALDEILYFNSYRIKTNGIKIFEEIFCNEQI
jgi:hypothetical protein